MNKFLDKSAYKRVPVSGLKLGMFVAELDRDWLETPFLLQGFIIKTPTEIRKLKEFCQYVYVDQGGKSWGSKKTPFNVGFQAPKRKLTGSDATLNSSSGKISSKPIDIAVINHDEPAYSIQVSAEAEHQAATKTYRAAHNVVSGLLDQARLGNVLDTNSAKLMVADCVDSILRNPNALMWVAKIKHADYYTMEHCLNVSILAIAFGRHLRLKREDIIRLGTGGMLHDIGKVKIPDDILNKPARLTEEEFEVMKQHTEIGKRLLMASGETLGYATDVAYNHHEKINGMGYPRGLFAQELSSYSRIISIVDAFDAMTSDRCYDKARSTLEALKIIYREKGEHFDEGYALEFIQLIGPYPPGTIVELVNGAVGIVLSSEEKKRHLPKIKLVLDQDKNPQSEEIIDLLHVGTANVGSANLDKGWLIHRVLKDGDYDIYLEQYPVRRALAGAKVLDDL